MAGITFQARETKRRPGVYVRTINVGGPAVPPLLSGVVALLRSCNWGPLGVPTAITSVDQARLLFNEPTTGPIMQALQGGAHTVLVNRIGAGGAAATVNVIDVTSGGATIGAVLTAKYVGTFGNGAAGGLKFIIRDHLVDTGLKQLLIYVGTALVQTINFTKGGSSESDALVAAVLAAGSDYIVATRGGGAGATIPNVGSTNFAGGSNPSSTSGDYTTGMGGLEPQSVQWNVVAVDTNDASIQAALGAFVTRVRDDGKRVMAVVGEPTSVGLSTRMTNAAAFNNLAVVYVANGFVDTAGNTIEGNLAAARVAAMIAAMAYNESLTHRIVQSAASVYGGTANFTSSQIESAIDAGAMVFSLNGASQVQVEYGITTLVTLSGQLDAGWKKIRRVRTRDALIERASLLTEPMIGVVTNNEIGQSQVVNAIQTVLDGMISEGGLRPGASVAIDPANPATADSAWFVIAADDLDSIEKLYETFGFRFSP